MTRNMMGVKRGFSDFARKMISPVNYKVDRSAVPLETRHEKAHGEPAGPEITWKG